MQLLLCGFGSIGRRHFTNARMLLPAATEWTVVEPNRASWQPAEEVRFVTSLNEATGDFDVALICSPTNLHSEQIASFAGRVGAFFIEKPLAHSDEALSLIRTALSEHPVPVMVGCNFRFDTGLRRVKQLLDDGAIGETYSIRAEFGQYLPSWRPQQDYRTGYAARRETGGGVILDRIHELDYVTWLFGPVAEVKAFSAKLSKLEIETEDTAEIALRFERGAFGSVHVDYLQHEYVCQLKIVGEAGTLTWRYKPVEVRMLRDGVWQTVYEEATPDVNAMYVAELRYFFDTIARGEQPMNGLAEAAATTALALAARAGG